MAKRRSIRAGIGEHINVISIPTDVGQEELCPENVTPVSSYNWLPGRTIAVLGINIGLVILLTIWHSKKMERTSCRRNSSIYEMGKNSKVIY